MVAKYQSYINNYSLGRAHFIADNTLMAILHFNVGYDNEDFIENRKKYKFIGFTSFLSI
jgi:hypothetical protein